MPTKPLPAEDLAHILTLAEPSFRNFQNANLFLTGGTGFFGHWLLESLLYANRELALNLRITALTRSAAAFRAKSPHITNDPALTLLEGDIATFAFPAQPHTHILHAATDSGGQQANQPPEALAQSILAGTQHVLDFAAHTGATRLLYTSTGAVYGRSTTLLHTPETYLDTHTPALPEHSYEAAKLAAENLCLAGTLNPEPWPLNPVTLAPVIARCFAFVGPHLPLDQHFAIGNFIGAAMQNQPIHIKGDGTPRRSWLYMADLAIWLWTLLAQGEAGRAYNVGSDDGMTIAEAAHLVADLLSSGSTNLLSSRSTNLLSSGTNLLSSSTDLLSSGTDLLSSGNDLLSSGTDLLSSSTELLSSGTNLLSSRTNLLSSRSVAEGPAVRTTPTLKVQIDGTPNPAAPLNSYVPDITRAHQELGLAVTVPLSEAIRRTAAWHTS